MILEHDIDVPNKIFLICEGCKYLTSDYEENLKTYCYRCEYDEPSYEFGESAVKWVTYYFKKTYKVEKVPSICPLQLEHAVISQDET